MSIEIYPEVKAALARPPLSDEDIFLILALHHGCVQDAQGRWHRLTPEEREAIDAKDAA